MLDSIVWVKNYCTNKKCNNKFNLLDANFNEFSRIFWNNSHKDDFDQN